MSETNEKVTNTLLDQAQANVLAAAQRQVSDWNAVLKSNYLTAFDNWSQSVIAGRSDNTNPPKPPTGFALGYFTDPTTGPGSVGPYGDTPILWAYPKANGGPVCDMPPVPGVVSHPRGVMLIGTSNPSAPEWFNAMEGDQTPVSTTAFGTSKDGISGLFQKYGGVAGYGYFRRIG